MVKQFACTRTVRNQCFAGWPWRNSKCCSWIQEVTRRLRQQNAEQRCCGRTSLKRVLTLSRKQLVLAQDILPTSSHERLLKCCSGVSSRDCSRRHRVSLATVDLPHLQGSEKGPIQDNHQGTGLLQSDHPTGSSSDACPGSSEGCSPSTLMTHVCQRATSSYGGCIRLALPSAGTKRQFRN